MSRVAVPPIERFWQHVEKTDDCWLWVGARTRRGYGCFWDGWSTNLSGLAHRFIWEYENGPIPPGMCILHKCDTPSCVRVDHLFLGTYEDNSRDMAAKGRAPMHRAKLTKEQVERIRQKLDEGRTQYSLAKEYGIGTSQMSRIANKKCWT